MFADNKLCWLMQRWGREIWAFIESAVWETETDEMVDQVAGSVGEQRQFTQVRSKEGKGEPGEGSTRNHGEGKQGSF